MSEEEPIPAAPGEVPPENVLQYAIPFGVAAEEQPISRQGNRLVTLRQVVLPPRCVKCNAPADGSYKVCTVTWYHPAWLALILLSIIILVIVVLCVQKKARIKMGLCRLHHQRRIRAVLMTWLFSLVGIAAIVAGPLAGEAYHTSWIAITGILTGVLSIIGAVVIGFTRARVLSPVKIDKKWAWLNGCGVEFLEQFPSSQ